MEKNPTHVWVGVIPDIFGYGINVVAHTRSDAEAALRKAYADWKVARPDSSTSFDTSFAYYAGYIIKVKVGDCYHDGFGS
jgi:hypothetical protein